MMARHQLKPTSLTTQRLRDSHLSQCATRYMYPILLDPKTKTVIVIVTELGHHQNFFPFSWLPSLSLSAPLSSRLHVIMIRVWKSSKSVTLTKK